jgi:hypothetical protein
MLHAIMNLIIDRILPKASLYTIDRLLKPPLAHFYNALSMYWLQRHDQAATSPLRSDPSTEWPTKHNQNTPLSRWTLSHCQLAALKRVHRLKLLLPAVYCYRWSGLRCTSKTSALLFSDGREMLVTSNHAFCGSAPLRMKFLRGMMFIVRLFSH